MGSTKLRNSAWIVPDFLSHENKKLDGNTSNFGRLKSVRVFDLLGLDGGGILGRMVNYITVK